LETRHNRADDCEDNIFYKKASHFCLLCNWFLIWCKDLHVLLFLF